MDLIKCPADQMNEVLQEFLGLSLEDMDGVGLDRFTYLPEYDAYYSGASTAMSRNWLRSKPLRLLFWLKD